MTPPQDAWLLGLGLTLCAAFFILQGFSRRPRVDPNRPIRQYKPIRWVGLAGAATLSLFALGRSDAVMFCALVFFAALLLIRPRGGSGKREEEDRGENPFLQREDAS